MSRTCALRNRSATTLKKLVETRALLARFLTAQQVIRSLIGAAKYVIPVNMNNQSQYFRNHRAEVAPFLPLQYHRVLEIGCGEGKFRANLKLPCEYTGVEPSEMVAKFALATLDQVHVGTFESVASQLPRKHFDLVICNDVIEHMVDHDQFLESIKRNMTADGVLVGSVPNVRYVMHLWDLMVKKDWQYADTGILDRTHLRFFTEKAGAPRSNAMVSRFTNLRGSILFCVKEIL